MVAAARPRLASLGPRTRDLFHRGAERPSARHGAWPRGFPRTRCATIRPCEPGSLQVPNLLPRPRLRTRPGSLPGVLDQDTDGIEPDVIASGGVRWINLERPREADREWL